MSERVLVQAPAEAEGGRTIKAWSQATKYRVASWVGLVLAIAALSDYALAFYPLGFGSSEWEMGTIGSVVQGLPLFSIGVVGVWVGAGGLGRRWVLWVVGLVLLAAAVLGLGLVVLFLTDVPSALQATQGAAQLGMKKLIVRTLFLGVLFSLSYIVTGVLALRQARGGSSKEAVA